MIVGYFKVVLHQALCFSVYAAGAVVPVYFASLVGDHCRPFAAFLGISGVWCGWAAGAWVSQKMG